MRSVLISVVIALCASPSLAGDDPLLARLAGDWIGRGLFRQSPEATPEHIYCRITNSLSEDGTTLTQKGRCAFASHTAAVESTLAAHGSGRYAGSGGGLGVASRAQATFDGTGTTNRLSFSAELTDTHSEESANATATVELLADGGYRLKALVTDKDTGETYTASEVVFAAQ
ncbi:MAG: hypothetical protein WD036_11125 [Bauldia sp.]